MTAPDTRRGCFEGMIAGVITQHRKPGHLRGFPWLVQSCCASLHPWAALGFSSMLEECPKQFALQWELNAHRALKSHSGLLGLRLPFYMGVRGRGWCSSQENQLPCTKLGTKPG